MLPSSCDSSTSCLKEPSMEPPQPKETVVVPAPPAQASGSGPAFPDIASTSPVQHNSSLSTLPESKLTAESNSALAALSQIAPGVVVTPDTPGDSVKRTRLDKKQPCPATSSKNRKTVSVKNKIKEHPSKDKKKASIFAERAKLLRRAGVTAATLKKFEGGCGRCRHVQYCTRSCWAKRGIVVDF